MGTVNLLKTFTALCLFGSIFYLGEWVRSWFKVRNMSYVDRANLQRETEVRNERKYLKKSILRKTIEDMGYFNDNASLVIGFLFLYIGISAVTSILLSNQSLSLLGSLPLTFVVVVSFKSYVVRRRREKATKQILQVLRQVITYLESGNPPVTAFNKAASLADNPLRDDLYECLNSIVGNIGLGEAMRPLLLKYPSAASRLLVAALEINDIQGSQLVPTLRQAENSAKKQSELAAEAVAEISQAKGEFIGVSVVIGLIALSLLSSTTKAAYSGVGTSIILFLGVANYAIGVWRTLRVFNKAKRGLV